jgi:hypothetical protein
MSIDIIDYVTVYNIYGMSDAIADTPLINSFLAPGLRVE